MFENAIRILTESLSPLEEVDKRINDETKAAILRLREREVRKFSAGYKYSPIVYFRMGFYFIGWGIKEIFKRKLEKLNHRIEIDVRIIEIKQ